MVGSLNDLSERRSSQENHYHCSLPLVLSLGKSNFKFNTFYVDPGNSIHVGMGFNKLSSNFSLNLNLTKVHLNFRWRFIELCGAVERNK